MGVHVILEIDPRGIDAEAWAAVHDETLALLEAWRPRLLGWGARTIEGARVPMYQRSLRQGEGDPGGVHWSVVGDRESLETAECQSLYRDLARYGRRGRRRDPAGDDLVVSAAAPENEDMSGPARVFGDKTQGHPYHFAVLAAAMVVEERFPRHAMVGGDIDRGQAEEARRLAAPILGRELPLPVRVDGPRLIERLRTRYQGEALAEAFERAFLEDEGARQEAMLRAFPGEDGAALWLRDLGHHEKPDTLGVIRLVISWLNAGRDLRELLRRACLSPDGPRFAPEELVDTLASTWVMVPLSARAPLDAFRRPRGAAHSVASLFGSILLDMEAMGRHLRIHLTPATIADALAEVFGDRGPALHARLTAESAKRERELRAHAGDVERLVEEAHDAAGDDTERLATLPSVDALGPIQKIGVRAMAWNTRRALASLREDTKTAALLGDLKEAKRALVRVLSTHTPTLTEDAWDAMLGEQDPEVVAWWLALACLSASELHASQVKRALFENPALGELARRLGRDEGEMRRVGEMIEKAQAK
jgi:hypothetical protein